MTSDLVHPKIQIIIGSTRQNRFSEKPAGWVFDEIQKRGDMDVELLDLRDYPLPFYDEPVSPSMFASTNHKYTNEAAIKWTGKIAEADGYVIVTPEYNHSFPGVLKNALDYGLEEWKHKPVGFVSYGSAGGSRGIEQLRQVVIELAMVPIKHSISITPQIYLAVKDEKVPVNPDFFKPLREGRVDRLAVFLDDLLWMTCALKSAREKEKNT